MNRMAPAIMALAFLASACMAPVVEDPVAGQAGPADPAAKMRPDLIVADPPAAAPGAVVALHFPAETSRGVLFVLEQRVGKTWALRYYLTSDGPGPGWRMTWHVEGAQGFGVEDIGVGGSGPDRVTIPEVAEPGDYRICTGNAGDEFCAPIEIAAP
jgi:hypothetical protein